MHPSRSFTPFVRPWIAAFALALAASAAHAAPVADVHAAAQQERQPLLDTLRDLVNIESGSKDVAGLNRIAERIASQLKGLGGAVEILQPPTYTASTTRPRNSARLCRRYSRAAAAPRSC